LYRRTVRRSRHYRYCAEYNCNLYSYLRYPNCHGVLAPEITNNPEGDLTWEIKDSGRRIVITDSDADEEDAICVKLVTGFISPDPQVKNEPV